MLDRNLLVIILVHSWLPALVTTWLSGSCVSGSLSASLPGWRCGNISALISRSLSISWRLSQFTSSLFSFHITFLSHACFVLFLFFHFLKNLLSLPFGPIITVWRFWYFLRLHPIVSFAFIFWLFSIFVFVGLLDPGTLEILLHFGSCLLLANASIVLFELFANKVPGVPIDSLWTFAFHFASIGNFAHFWLLHVFVFRKWRFLRRRSQVFVWI